MVVVSCLATQFIYPPYPPLFAAIIYSSSRRLGVSIPEHKKGPLVFWTLTLRCQWGAVTRQRQYSATNLRFPASSSKPLHPGCRRHLPFLQHYTGKSVSVLSAGRSMSPALALRPTNLK